MSLIGYPVCETRRADCYGQPVLIRTKHHRQFLRLDSYAESLFCTGARAETIVVSELQLIPPLSRSSWKEIGDLPC